MNILILSGGTGSVQLQKGLHTIFNGIGELDITVLVNAYDNGLSTGIVRQVFDGNILGPSDVRKNQILLHEIKYGKTQLSKFLDIRFSLSADEVYPFIMAELDEVNTATLPVDKRMTLLLGIDKFFKNDNSKIVDYSDFSLSNIIYAGLAAMNDNSLRKAASIMADILNIPDKVILNSDISLFLNAETESGQIINDEAEIVAWNDKTDIIKDVFLTTAKGHKQDAMLCGEAVSAILSADIIISSSGTQWSSLIPTYKSLSFKTAYEQSNAKKYLIMNKTQDADMLGISANEIINTVKRFISLKDTTIIVDSDGDKLLSSVDFNLLDGMYLAIKGVIYDTFRNRSFITENEKNKKHDGVKLVDAIFTDYYSTFILNAQTMVFDYDDTLVGRGNTFVDASNFNREALVRLHSLNRTVIIVTGNSIKALSLWSDTFDKPAYDISIDVYADGGINCYYYNLTQKLNPSQGSTPWTFATCVDRAKLFTSAEAKLINDAVKTAGINTSKLENRHNATISLKPIDNEYRQAVSKLLKFLLPEYDVRINGRTTIDITKHGANKGLAAEHLIIKGYSEIVYVGDEIDHGNDAPFVGVLSERKNLACCVRVKNPIDTAMFLIMCFKKMTVK